MDQALLNFSDYLTIKEAAKFLGVVPNTLRNWERDGKIKPFRSPMSNYRLYKKSDLKELLSKQYKPAHKIEKILDVYEDDSLSPNEKLIRGIVLLYEENRIILLKEIED